MRPLTIRPEFLLKENDEFLLMEYPPPEVFVTLESRGSFYSYARYHFPIHMTFMSIHGSGTLLQFNVKVDRYNKSYSFYRSILNHLDPITL